MSKITIPQPSAPLGTFQHWLGRVPVSHPFERRQALALQIGLLVLLGSNPLMTVLSLLNSAPGGFAPVLLSNLVIVS